MLVAKISEKQCKRMNRQEIKIKIKINPIQTWIKHQKTEKQHTPNHIEIGKNYEIKQVGKQRTQKITLKNTHTKVSENRKISKYIKSSEQLNNYRHQQQNYQT